LPHHLDDELSISWSSLLSAWFLNGQAAEIFQSGVIPADTDYRIFRDFGEIPGIDMAFYRNGYVKCRLPPEGGLLTEWSLPIG
jgi:hypothetical protein